MINNYNIFFLFYNNIMSNSFNTVRISSHGSFIDKPLYIYERPENENEIKKSNTTRKCSEMYFIH